MNYDDLLPCPFCGSAEHLRYEFAGSQGYTRICYLAINEVADRLIREINE